MPNILGPHELRAEGVIADPDDLMLITGSNGFIGSRVVMTLLKLGFTNLRCFVRPSSSVNDLQAILDSFPEARVELIQGNLLSREDCDKAAKDVKVIYNLAAGIEKTFAGSFMNSVVTTRNLLDATLRVGRLCRFVHVSSFAVYSNWNIKRGGLLNESCELERHYVDRAEAYTFAKLKQEQIVVEYGRDYGTPYVILRPGAVYGPGARQMTPRVGIDTFGIFVHLGGGNTIPLSYVDNCAQAVVLGGLKPGIDGEAFNVVDDDLPSSRKFLKMYKRHGRRFTSISVPYWLFYGLCWGWERYSVWSKGQLPLSFNRRRCAAYWKGNTYTNQKLKTRLGWKPAVTFREGSNRYFEYVRETT